MYLRHHFFALPMLTLAHLTHNSIIRIQNTIAFVHRSLHRCTNTESDQPIVQILLLHQHLQHISTQKLVFASFRQSRSENSVFWQPKNNVLELWSNHRYRTVKLANMRRDCFTPVGYFILGAKSGVMICEFGAKRAWSGMSPKRFNRSISRRF